LIFTGKRIIVGSVIFPGLTPGMAVLTWQIQASSPKGERSGLLTHIAVLNEFPKEHRKIWE